MSPRTDPDVAALPGERAVTEVAGVPVSWERWARPGGVPLVLVHGTSAHSGWWHHTVPHLRDAYDVVAVDLSGHGESGRRAVYSLPGWAREVTEVATGAFGEPPVVVGHSIGGLVAAGAAAGGAARALVLVDCIVEEPSGTGRVRPVMRQDAVYSSADEAMARYRLMPPQPVPDDTVLAYVARTSLRETTDGWTWKVDPSIFGALDVESLTAPLHEITCPTAAVRGELSPLMPADAGSTLAELLGDGVAQYDVPDAHHHLMIDQGPAFSRVLRRALDDLTPPPPPPDQEVRR